MSANLENTAVAKGLEKVSFHSNPNEKQYQKCSNHWTITLISHVTKVTLKLLKVRLASRELKTSRHTSWI